MKSSRPNHKGEFLFRATYPAVPILERREVQGLASGKPDLVRLKHHGQEWPRIGTSVVQRNASNSARRPGD